MLPLSPYSERETTQSIKQTAKEVDVVIQLAEGGSFS